MLPAFKSCDLLFDIGLWIRTNYYSQHVWFFIAGTLLFCLYFIQIWVNFALGEVWTAVLMELLCVTSVIICIVEIKIDSIRFGFQKPLYNSYQFLNTVEGRTLFYAFISFLSFSTFTSYHAMSIIGGFILMLLTLTRFVVFYRSKVLLQIYIMKVEFADEFAAFDSLDTDGDGYLLLKHMDTIISIAEMIKMSRWKHCRHWLKEIIFWRLDAGSNDDRVSMNEFIVFYSNFKKKHSQKTVKPIYNSNSVKNNTADGNSMESKITTIVKKSAEAVQSNLSIISFILEIWDYVTDVLLSIKLIHMNGFLCEPYIDSDGYQPICQPQRDQIQDCGIALLVLSTIGFICGILGNFYGFKNDIMQDAIKEVRFINWKVMVEDIPSLIIAWVVSPHFQWIMDPIWNLSFWTSLFMLLKPFCFFFKPATAIAIDHYEEQDENAMIMDIWCGFCLFPLFCFAIAIMYMVLAVISF
eukprot:215479_1